MRFGNGRVLVNLIPAKPQIVLLDAGTVSWISKIASGVQKNPRADNDHKHACLSSSSLQYTLRYLKSQRTRYLFVSATSLFSADSSSSSANASAARIQFVSATLVFGLAAFDCSLAISSSHTSLGVLYPRSFIGVSLISPTIASSSSCVRSSKLVPLGR